MGVLGCFPGGVGVKMPDVEELWSFSGNTAVVNSVATDLQGYVYSGGGDKVLRKIDSIDGTLVWSFTGHTGEILAVAGPKYGIIYTVSNDKTVRSINWADGTQRWSFALSTIGTKAFAVGSEMFLGCTDNTIQQLDDYNGARLGWVYKGHTANINSIAVFVSGTSTTKWIYSGSDDKSVRKLSQNGTSYASEVWKFTGHTAAVTAVATDKNGNVYSGSRDKTLRKIGDSGTEIWCFTGHTNTITTIATHLYGNIYTGCGDNTIRKINGDTGRKVWDSVCHPAAATSICTDQKGFLYGGFQDKKVCRFAEPIGVMAFRKNEPFSSPLPIYGIEDTGGSPTEKMKISVSPAPRRIVVDGARNIYIGTYWGTVQKISHNGTIIWDQNKHSSVAVKALTLDESGNIYSGGADDKILKTNKDGINVWSFTGHSNSVNSICLGGDGVLYSASSDRTLRKINNSNGVQVWSYATSNPAVSVASGPYGKIYCSTNDGMLYKIDGERNTSWISPQGSIPIESIVVDKEENVYVSQHSNIRKIQSNGRDYAWAYKAYSQGSSQSLAIGIDGYVYGGGGGEDKNMCKIRTDGTVMWRFTDVEIITDIAIAPVKNRFNETIYATYNDSTVKQFKQGFSFY